MSDFKALLGKTISSVKLDKASARKYIIFHTTEGEKFHFKTEDVYEAARTWINGTTGLLNLIGHEVILVHDSDENEDESFSLTHGLSVFNVNIVTLKGTFTIDCRTSHDGIDEGRLVLSREDSFINAKVIPVDFQKTKYEI